MSTEDREIETATTLVKWLDGRYLDPIIGLVIPEAGDFITSLAGLYLVVLAIRRKLPAVVVARMLLNLGLDALIGAVPVVGDLFDFAYRANTRNLELLVSRRERHAPKPSDWLVVGGAAAFLLAALALPIVLTAWLVSWLSS